LTIYIFLNLSPFNAPKKKKKNRRGMLARNGGVCFGHQESFEGGIPFEANYLTTCLYMDVYTSIVVGWDETPKSKILKKETMMFLPSIVETFFLKKI